MANTNNNVHCIRFAFFFSYSLSLQLWFYKQLEKYCERHSHLRRITVEYSLFASISLPFFLSFFSSSHTNCLEKSSTAFFTRIIRFTSTYIRGIYSIGNGRVGRMRMSNKILICVSRLNLLLLICHTLLAVYLIWRQLCHEMRFTQ